jgi:hypothetical protein
MRSLSFSRLLSAPQTLHVAEEDSFWHEFPIANGKPTSDNIDKIVIPTCIDIVEQIYFGFFGSRRVS